MPTTRHQAALDEKHAHAKSQEANDGCEVHTGGKRQAEPAQDEKEQVKPEPPMKKLRAEDDGEVAESQNASDTTRHIGVIERGHIYFFYRPRVQHEEAHSIDDVQRLHMLLVPRPPKFSAHNGEAPRAKLDKDDTEDIDMTVLQPGADALPAHPILDSIRQHYRLITIGKKALPDPSVKSRSGRVFWATVVAVGDDLSSLEKGMGERSYETKTRGVRHEEPARLVARGAYAIVNNEPSVPSKAETHLGFYISHPEEMGDVQKALGIYKASSFAVQVKNPLAPNTGGQRTPSPSKRAQYPAEFLSDMFGKGTRGRESYGLKFVDCRTIELLEYEGAELLLIASRSDKDGLEASLGEGRGEAMEHLEEVESSESIAQVFRELALEKAEFPQEALNGEWI